MAGGCGADKGICSTKGTAVGTGHRVTLHYNAAPWLGVHTQNHISEENVQQCIEILNREDGSFLWNESMHTPELKEWRETFVQV